MNRVNAEILGLIFGYMTHTQMLICRLVCTDWNLQISTMLGKTSHFELTSKESNEIMLDSNVEWTKIKITDMRTTVLPKEFKKLVTSLQMYLSVPLPQWMKLLSSFPALKTLHIHITEEKKKSDAQVEIPKTEFQKLRTYFRKMMEGLEELSVTFPYMNYKALNDFLGEVNCVEMCVKKLCIKENWPAKTANTLSGNNIDHTVYLSSLLLRVRRIISMSSSTLTYLELDFNSNKIRNELMPVFVSKLSEVKELKLKSALILHNPIDEHIERDFVILQEFLNIQMTTGVLKNIILPWSSNASLCQDIVRSLPRDIESVGNVRTEHFTDDFPWKFKNLSLLSVGEDVTREIMTLGQDCDNIQQLHVELKKFDFVFDGQGYLYDFIADGLSHLTELKFVGNGGTSFNDSDLDRITSDLKQLRVLHIENSEISDGGVSGLEDLEYDEDIQELVRTNKIYFYPNFFNEDAWSLNPLSSLENLEKLVLTGCKITDVGIILGFRFGSKLKHLTLGSNSNKVSDLGLHCLGINNPGLEAFNGYFQSGLITTIGIENMKKQLPLINSTQQFKVVNLKPKMKT